MIKVRVIQDELVTVNVYKDDEISVGLLGELFRQPSNPYQGSYEVTPSMQTKTLFTAGKELEQNVIVYPIPRNYGLITYSGFELTVS